jgi:hypothetical protein
MPISRSHPTPQLSSCVLSLQQQVEVVATASATAASDLSGRVEGLAGDVAEMKGLLLALLARQQ